MSIQSELYKATTVRMQKLSAEYISNKMTSLDQIKALSYASCLITLKVIQTYLLAVSTLISKLIFTGLTEC